MRDEDDIVGEEYLPVVTGGFGARPVLADLAPHASFVSQLIAARQRLMPQRERRRETPAVAARAYAVAATTHVRRMPAGYRTTRVV